MSSPSATIRTPAIANADAKNALAILFLRAGPAFSLTCAYREAHFFVLVGSDRIDLDRFVALCRDRIGMAVVNYASPMNGEDGLWLAKLELPYPA